MYAEIFEGECRKTFYSILCTLPFLPFDISVIFQIDINLFTNIIRQDFPILIYLRKYMTEIGYEVGLISQERYDALCEKRAMIEAEIERMLNTPIYAGERSNIKAFFPANFLAALIPAIIP